MQKIVSAFFIVLTLALLTPHPSYAVSTAEKLRQLEQTLASEKKDNAKYRNAQIEAENLLKALQKKLIKQTEILQKTENDLIAIQDKQAATQQAADTLEQELQGQHQKLADLLMAAARLQRVPPEAMLLRPGTPIDAARTNLLLQHTTPEIAAQANAIKDDLTRLTTLKDDLATQNQKLAKLQKQQHRQQNQINADIKTRQALVVASAAKADKSADTISRLNDEAADLRSILADLARRPPANLDKRPVVTEEVPKKSGWGKSVLSFFRSGGPTKLPITGKIRTSYGEKLASGANSQGLSIAGTPGGVVIAPEKGTIRFAGPFRQYRLLVIIEHAGGYHSLLGGLHDVYAKVGSTVAAGEPIGKLESDAAHANLYYEVRRNGKPVDPRG